MWPLIKAMEDEREVKAIGSCVETQSQGKNKEMLGNVVKRKVHQKEKVKICQLVKMLLKEWFHR